MRVVILADGLATRLSEETDVRPKPMVEIGGRPILWHVMIGEGWINGGYMVLAPRVFDYLEDSPLRGARLDGAKARRLLDWQPLFTLDDGPRRTIRWYREFLGEGG